MPYIKSISVHTTPEKTIAYVVDRDKTENLTYVSGLNVSAIPHTAYEEMKAVFETYSTHAFDEMKSVGGKASVKLFHFVQSFRPTDEITPETAHKIAGEFAKSAFGNERQIVIATHVDKGHIHSHIVLNPYDFNGRKFNSNRETLSAVRRLSDTICLAYGIEPIPENKHKSVSYKEWSERQTGTSWKQSIKDDIDRLIYDVDDIEELYKKLSEKYEIRRGKHTTITVPDSDENVKKKSVRIDNKKSFGPGYDDDSLTQRIGLAKEQKKVAEQHRREEIISAMSAMERLYSQRIYEVSELVRNGRKIPKKYDRKLPYSVENDFEIYHIAKQLQIIRRDKIGSVDELEKMIKDVEQSCEECRQQFSVLDEKERQLKMVIENAEQYFSLKSKSPEELTQADRLKLQISEKIVIQCGIRTADDIQSVRQLYEKNTAQSSALKEKFELLERRYREYVDISHKYKTLSAEDYITKLMRERKLSSGTIE